jgi:hypothetical protein
MNANVFRLNHVDEILDYAHPVRGLDGFGMELDAEYRELSVSDSHYFMIVS